MLCELNTSASTAEISASFLQCLESRLFSLQNILADLSVLSNNIDTANLNQAV